MASSSDFEFDSVIYQDKVVKGDKFGEFKLLLDGMKTSDTAGTKHENSCIEVWCKMGGKRYSFLYRLPSGATIDATTLKITEQKKGKLKVYFKKTSDFQLRDSK